MRTIANARSVGLAFSWLAVLFLLFDSTGKLFQGTTPTSMEPCSSGIGCRASDFRLRTSGLKSEAGRSAKRAAPENVHVATVTMRPSARGRRYKNSTNGVSVVDGPLHRIERDDWRLRRRVRGISRCRRAMGGAVHRCGPGRRSSTSAGWSDAPSWPPNPPLFTYRP